MNNEIQSDSRTVVDFGIKPQFVAEFGIKVKRIEAVVNHNAGVAFVYYRKRPSFGEAS